MTKTKFEFVVEDARRLIAQHGYAEITREMLDAGWLSAGLAPAVAMKLDVPFARNDRNGSFIFGAGADDPCRES